MNVTNLLDAVEPRDQEWPLKPLTRRGHH